MTPEQFFLKNMKYIALLLFFLLALAKVQSCNKAVRLDISTKQYDHVIDSLKDKCQISQDSIQNLNFELKLAKANAKSADEKANAVQSVAEKLKTNTTVNVRGAQIDTVKTKK